MAGLAEELERFEAELEAQDNEGAAEDKQAEGTPEQEPEAGEPEAESVEGGEAAEGSTDQPEPGTEKPVATEKVANLTTLPDDKEAFGELAGQQVTAEQLIAAGLLQKLVTWGHQGRYMVQKGQKELEVAKQEKSEAQKLRELLEERFKKEDQVQERTLQPTVSEEQFAGELQRAYLPALQKIAEQNGIEVDFVKEFPKVASHIEHRFQSGANLLQGLVKQVDELVQFVGMQKEQQRTETAKGYFEGVLDKVSQSGELFKPLSDPKSKVDFVKWVSNDDTGLRMATKDVKDITAADIEAAWLLYVHKNPSVLNPAAAPKPKTQAHLAGGGGGKNPGKKTRSDTDELEEFDREMRSLDGRREF